MMITGHDDMNYMHWNTYPGKYDFNFKLTSDFKEKATGNTL